MNYKKFLLPGITLLAVATVSCSDKKEGEEPGGSNTNPETAQECKEYLASSTTEFLNLFNPNDQREFIEFAAYFSDTYADYDLPSQFDIEEEENLRYNPAQYIMDMAKGARGELDYLTRAAYVYTYNINFDRFAGKYEPDSRSERWLHTADSKDIIFLFTDKDLRPCELRIYKDGNGTSDFTIDYTDEDYYDNYSEHYIYNLSIPHTVKAELKQNGKVIASSKVTSKIDLNGHKISAAAEAEVANIKATVSLSGDDKKITAEADIKIDGSTKCSTKATINGNGLCDRDNIEDLIDSEWNSSLVAATFKDGTCNADMLGKVQVTGTITYTPDIIDALDQDWSSYEYDNTTQAEVACRRACRVLNDNIKAYLRFNGKSKNQAELTFQPYLDSWDYGNHWEYYCNPELRFNDDSTMSFEDYFSEGFSSVENKWRVLIDSYEQLWNASLPK